MDVSTLEITHDRQAERFEAQLGEDTAVLDYTLRNRTMTITYTGVPRPFGGRGIASKLTETALTYARDEGYKVAPLCPFAARYISRHPEHQGLRE